jgi:DNA-binding response OmpR family regulator
MANILIMDDDDGKTEDIRRELSRSGHKVDKLKGQNSRSLFESLQQIAAESAVKWDLGILDINHATDAFGGMRLWERVKAARLHTKFTDVVICTIYAGGLDTDALLRVKAFAKENDIPEENILDFSSTNFRPFISRIEQLITTKT